MGYFFNTSDINQTFIIEPLSITGGSPTLTACTALYTNAVVSCDGDTQIFMGTGVITFDGNLYTNNDLTADVINASTYYSGGTNLFDIIDSKNITGGTFNNNTDTLSLYKTNGSIINVTGFTDYYTTGSTVIGTTAYFDRNDKLSAYTLNLSAFTADTFVTGVTFSNNQLVIVKNNGTSISTFINTFTGLTINGLLRSNSISATTITANTITATKYVGLPVDVYVTGGTYSNGVSTFTNITGGTFNVSGYTTPFTGGTVTGDTVFTNGLTASTFSATTYLGLPIDYEDYLPLSGGTVTGSTVFTDGLTANTFSATTYYGLPLDIHTTAFTFNPATYDIAIKGNDGVNYTQNLSILATDMTITGGTYNINTGVVTFTNNTGGTFSVSGFSSGMTDSFTVSANLSGETIQFSNNLQGLNFYNVSLTPLLSGKTNLSLFAQHTGDTNNPHQTSFSNLISTAHTHSISDVIGLVGALNNKFEVSGGTISGGLTANTISATTYYNLPQDVYVTGSSFNTSSKTLRNTRNDNTNIDVILPVRTFLTAATTTTNSTLQTIDTITGITDNSNVFIVSYLNAYKDSVDYGFWKRTLAVNKVSGLVSVIGENSDFDRVSSGMTANSVIYSANSGNIAISVSGETAKSYTWKSNWEIIK